MTDQQQGADADRVPPPSGLQHLHERFVAMHHHLHQQHPRHDRNQGVQQPPGEPRFGLLDYNINVVVDPGETKTVTFKAKKKGVFPYYCTNFCSALHQEMQGYLLVRGNGTAARPRTAGPGLAAQ